MSNTVGIAIHEVGRPCQDQVDWFRESVEHASRAGFVVLASISLADSAEEYRLDYGLGSFGRQETGQRPLPATPPFHTCTQTTETINFRQVLGQARSPSTWTLIPKPVPGNRRLDAGTTLQVSGPRGARQLGRDPQRLEFYNALLGGHVPLTRTPPAPLFLRPGAYTIAGMGGADIGAFSSRLQVLRPIAWTNRAQIQEVERDRGVTVEWSASWKTDAVLIAAGSSDRFSGDSALAVCLAPAREGRFLIPATALANLPASGEGRGLEAGYLLIAEIPIQPPARIRASGLDSGFAAFVSASARTVRYK